jgi:uncharacterized delta-60 repeat protein
VNPHVFLARLNPDGSPDPTFNVGTGFDRAVYALHIQSDGKILVAGYFSVFNGQSHPYIVRLTESGTIDSTFQPPTLNGIVYAITQTADQKILVGGDFTSPRAGLIRLGNDGSVDSDFAPNIDRSVRSILVQPDGKVVIGGIFTSVDGHPRDNVARLTASGALDPTFGPETSSSSVSISSLAADGPNFLVGGDFHSLNAINRPYVARLLGDRSLLSISTDGNSVFLNWSESSFVLQSAPAVDAPWTTEMPLQTTGSTQSPTAGQKFFRLTNQP